MTKKILKKYIFLIVILFLITFTFKTQNANEILLYADDISYDKNKNLIAKGNAKVIYQNKIIISDLIIYSKNDKKIILPIEFNMKDEKNNYYYGTSGYFSNDLNYGTIDYPKILLNDKSRIVGKKAKRDGDIDIITKAVYSPCVSKIKIANFLCPIWQLEGEKILHDYDKLFLYQKHSKMRVLNVPVFYSPYLVTPSPLRTERKSGFLNPSMNLNFFDTKTAQSLSLPYYFNISEDKELTFTPTINYGAGVDSSQRFNFDYNQILSGGNFTSNITFDSTFENSNTDKWLKEGSIINNYNKNLNERYNIQISSAFQTAKNYIQQTSPSDDLSYSSSLKTSMTLNGYNFYKIDDKLKLNITAYQSLQNNEDNKTIPTILPFITFDTGKSKYKKITYTNNFEFYNIFRDTPTDIHSKSQKKLSTIFSTNSDFIKYRSRINLKSNFYNQFYDVEDKKIDNVNVGSHYFRSFPIFGLSLETPFKNNLFFKNLIYTPKISLVMAPGMSNTNKISNEDSSINSYTIQNNSSLNRFTGTDKLDNSKRINFSMEAKQNNFDFTVWQSYEFTDNSNFHYSQGNEKKLSDLLGEINYQKEKYLAGYNFRYDVHNNYNKSQNLDLEFKTKFGNLNFKYLDQKSKTNDIILTDNETLNYNYNSLLINKYSKISLFGLYDFKANINKENGLNYSYFDECFGVNIDFKRNSYTEDNLKPQDILTVMFSFKNVGSYRSTNLAVSENDKQDIQWDTMGINNELFN